MALTSSLLNVVFLGLFAVARNGWIWICSALRLFRLGGQPQCRSSKSVYSLAIFGGVWVAGRRSQGVSPFAATVARFCFASVVVDKVICTVVPCRIESFVMPFPRHCLLHVKMCKSAQAIPGRPSSKPAKLPQTFHDGPCHCWASLRRLAHARPSLPRLLSKKTTVDAECGVGTYVGAM